MNRHRLLNFVLSAVYLTAFFILACDVWIFRPG